MKSKNEFPSITPSHDSYQILMKGRTANILLMLLISSITIILPILLKQTSTIFYLSTPFYFTIIILFWSILYLQAWGIFVAVITLAVSGCFLDIPQRIYATNTAINILQVIFLLVATSVIRSPNKLGKKLYYQEGAFYLSLYNFTIIIILLAYIVASIFYGDNMKSILMVLSPILFLFTILKVIIKKDFRLMAYSILVAFLPSAICSCLSAWLCSVPKDMVLGYISVWTLSNYIFLQTIGYIFFQLFFLRKIRPFKYKEIVAINVSSAAYFVAIILLNTLIIYLLFSHVIEEHGYIYFFPWLLGNVFLLANFYFTNFDDASSEDLKTSRFKVYENRIITIEKNTAGIITIISFILPLSVNFLRGSIPTALIVLFSSNIFFACLSVGLVWIPNNKIRFISLLKTLKTISYTYSITLLLVSTIMIMFLLQSTN